MLLKTSLAMLAEEIRYGGIFVAFIKKNGAFKSLDVPTDGFSVVNKVSVEGKKLVLDVEEFAKPLVFESGDLKYLAVPASPR